MRRLTTGACPLRERVRSAARAQDGSFLIEALVSAFIVLVVGFGVIELLDRGTELGGEQRTQAVAGNVAQSELESIRALPVSGQSNLRRAVQRTVGGVTYSISSRADWVNDSSGDANCTVAGSRTDYMKISTVVTWPDMSGRKPVTLESISTPGVRAFGADQGSLAVKISDGNGDAVSGVQLNLSGGATLSDATNAAGCVMWGFLPVAASYSLSASRTPDYVTPDGAQTAVAPITLSGGATTTRELRYARGGYIAANFVTKRTADISSLMPTEPKNAHVTHSGMIAPKPLSVTSSSGTSGLLFPFTSAYAIHADSCSAAEVPVPAPLPSPRLPAAPTAAAATVKAGTTTDPVTVQLPALNIKVKSDGEFKPDAIVRVTTPCGTVYRRTTTSNGEITDPGFPYAESLDICVSDGTHERTLTRSNKNFNVTIVLMSIVSSTDASGTCA
jgi:Tfp pilus assembly protein PilV